MDNGILRYLDFVRIVVRFSKRKITEDIGNRLKCTLTLRMAMTVAALSRVKNSFVEESFLFSPRMKT